MNTDNLLTYFTWVNNMSRNQTNQLFELCDSNFELLMEVSAKMKKNFVYSVPSNKEVLSDMLKLKL